MVTASQPTAKARAGTHRATLGVFSPTHAPLMVYTEGKQTKQLQRVRQSSQGTIAVLTQTLFAWQSQIKKAQLISPLPHKNSKNKNKPTPKSSVRQFYSLSLQLRHSSCNTQRQRTAPSMCSPSTLSISLASNCDVGQQGLALLIYVFFIYRRHRPTFNHLFAVRHPRQPLACLHPAVTGVPGLAFPTRANPLGFQLCSKMQPNGGPAACPPCHSIRPPKLAPCSS